MDPELENLRKQLAELPLRGKKRIYTADVRRRVVAWVEKHIAEGETEAAASKDVGIHQATVAEWRRGPKKNRQRGRVRPVELRPTSSSTLKLTLPGGAQVEGLGLDELIELARALR